MSLFIIVFLVVCVVIILMWRGIVTYKMWEMNKLVEDVTSKTEVDLACSLMQYFYGNKPTIKEDIQKIRDNPEIVIKHPNFIQKLWRYIFYFLTNIYPEFNGIKPFYRKEK